MKSVENFELAGDYAAFRPTGQMSLAEIVEAVAAAIAMARERDIRKLLVDASRASGFGYPSLGSRYFAVHDWAEASGGVVRIAVVLPSGIADPEKFGVTVAGNAGLIGDVFSSEDEALAWLTNLA